MPVNTLGATTYANSDQNTIKKSAYSKKAQISTSGNDVMSMSDFYKIMAAQIQYQDADNPMDTSQMLAQMVQTQMIQSINQMSQINLTTYASSMVGQEVRVAKINSQGMFDGEVTGIVTGVDLYGSEPIIYIGDKGYTLSQIMSIGKTPTPGSDKEPEDGDEKPGEGDEKPNDVPGEGGTPGADGPDGNGGTPGADGPDGSGGTPGADGSDGSGGTPGTDGPDGSSGTPGTDGTGGSSGTPGTDGTGGTPGTGGTDDTPGTDGTGGATGGNGGASPE